VRRYIRGFAAAPRDPALWRELSLFYSSHDFNNVNYLVIKARKRGTNNVVASLHSQSTDFRNSSGDLATFAAIRRA
jgi:hypothetical protein